ncbi:MAG: GNAT family N-acetyltransferase [Legionellales bacterium]|nr:GNAT family N-acetyltransferase [Legionellales bacterium]
MTIIILPMQQEDIEAVAQIHAQKFSRQMNSLQWVSCNFAAFPRIMLFVARDEANQIVGYIQWMQKSGFRQEVVIELEQIAVLSSYQGIGIGTQLIKESLQQIEKYLAQDNSQLKAILISTRHDNPAKTLYENILAAKKIAVIKDLYSSDEVLLLALLK